MSFAIPVSARNRPFQFAPASPVGTTPVARQSRQRSGQTGRTSVLDALLWLTAGSMIVIGVLVLLVSLGDHLASSPLPIDVFGAHPVADTIVPLATPTVTAVPPEEPVRCDEEPTSGQPPPPLIVPVLVPYPVIQERTVYVPMESSAYNYRHVTTDYGAIQGQTYHCGMAFAYTVQPGDTVFRLARRFGVSPQTIISANSLWNPNYIRIGQVLQIPCMGGY